MKTQKTRENVLLVLVPHRDVRLVLRKYSAAHPCAALFKEGFTGAFHFPWVAPLASLSAPLNIEELKHCARAVRQAVGGKFICEQTDTEAIGIGCRGAKLFGSRLESEGGGGISLSREALGSEKITALFAPPVIGSLLITAEADMEKLPPPPALSFRAAALANMFWQSLQAETGGGQSETIGFKWKIGRLFWLPKVI